MRDLNFNDHCNLYIHPTQADLGKYDFQSLRPLTKLFAYEHDSHLVSDKRF